MATRSKIEWTEQTWNPVVGCSIVSPGCTNCYAMKMAARIEAMSESIYDKGERTALAQYCGTTKKVNGNAVWTGKLNRAPDETLFAPLRRKKPTMYFVNSMSDLFHEDCPDEWIDRVFAIMALTPQHTYQVLTKRAARMRDYILSKRMRAPEWISLPTEGIKVLLPYEGGWPTNIWLGVSTERQQEADERIPLLLQTPAAVRFISAEPLLGPINLGEHVHAFQRHECFNGRTRVHGHFFDERCPACAGSGVEKARIDWVIVGGESGPGARPMHPDWARSLRDQCAAARVPFFFKQWGEYLPVGQSLPGYGKIHGATAVKPGRMKLHYGGTSEHAPEHAFGERGIRFASTDDGRLTFRVGKQIAGRLLDGVEHNAFPSRETDNGL